MMLFYISEDKMVIKKQTRVFVSGRDELCPLTDNLGM